MLMTLQELPLPFTQTHWGRKVAHLLESLAWMLMTAQSTQVAMRSLTTAGKSKRYAVGRKGGAGQWSPRLLQGFSAVNHSNG
jgi:hypothetical protein